MLGKPLINSHMAFSGFSPPVNKIPEIFSMDIEETAARHATITSALSPGVIINEPYSIRVKKFCSCIAATVKL